MRNNEKCTFPLLAICKIDTIPYFATENSSDWTIIYKSSISSLSYQPRNYWVNSKYSIYSKNNLKKFELSSQLNSAWLLWTVDAVLLPKVISCATFAPPTPNFLPPLQSEANGIQCKKYIFLGNGPQKGREILNSNQH